MTKIQNNTHGERTLQLSKYFAEYDIPSTVSDNYFAVLSLNAQCLAAKLDQLKIYLENLKQRSVTFDAICIQETWINANSNMSMYAIDGYELIAKDKTCGEHGGLAIYLRENFTYKLNEIPQKYSHLWECQSIEIYNECLNNITLTNTYRPPRNLVENCNEFMEDMEMVLDKFDSLNAPHVIAGDFNMNLLKLNKDKAIDKFFELVTSYDYKPEITMPTRFNGMNSSLLDNFYCKYSVRTCCHTAGIIESNVSDHYPYFMMLKMKNQKVEVQKYITISTYNAEAIQKLRHELNQIDFKSMLEFRPDQDSEANFENNFEKFLKTLTSLIQTHLPTKRVRFNKRKHKICKWITNGIIYSVNYRDRLFRKLKKTDISSKEYGELKQNLKVYNGILKKLIRNAKADYYNSCFERTKNDTRKTWENINEILGRPRSSKVLPEKIKYGSESYSNTVDISKCFNKYFTDIGKELASKIEPPMYNSFRQYMTNPTHKVFKLREVNIQDISKIIKELKSKTSKDPYGMSNKILKDIVEEIIAPLTLLVNQAISTGKFPEKLKMAKVIPVYKKAEKENVENYRPISVLPVLSKVFEKTMHKQLQEYFETNNLFYDRQYGFRKGHSTELAVLDLMDTIYWSIETAKVPINIFIDLTKAFDTINHDIMCSKLEYYGIKGKELKLFRNYLFNRQQYVEFNSVHSSPEKITIGVPQGSILGPLLFIIYMNDLQMTDTNFEILLYADDTTLTYKADTTEQGLIETNHINHDLGKISTWLKANKLTINSKKTKFMTFHPRQKKIKLDNIYFNSQQIEKVDTFNCLGIILDTHITFDSHIKSMASSMAKTIGSMNSIKKFVAQKTLKQIYNSLIQSRLYYGITVWGQKANCLLKLQKRAVRIVMLSKYNAHTDPLLKALKILKTTDLYVVQLYKLFYKIQNGKVPLYFKHLFQNNRTIKQYNTRSTYIIPPIYTKLTITHNCIQMKLIKIINTAEEIIINKVYTHCIEGFAHYIKITLLKQYNDTCTIQNCYICQNV